VPPISQRDDHKALGGRNNMFASGQFEKALALSCETVLSMEEQYCQMCGKRAATHFELGNFQKTILDCNLALTFAEITKRLQLSLTFLELLARACLKLPISSKICAWCGKCGNLLCCGNCKLVYYCSKDTAK
jgi:hypothetical protein